MTKLVDGQKVEITVYKGSKNTQPNSDYSERTLTGTLRKFEQADRVYDEEGIAIGKETSEHWEILTGDPTYPAVGIVPEQVLNIKKL